MNRSRMCFVLISSSLFILISSGAYAADLDAGRRASTQCAICHGENGEGNGAPKSRISGMDIDKFKKHINEYKQGVRRNVMMQRFTKNLSDQDIVNLAAYYAIQ